MSRYAVFFAALWCGCLFDPSGRYRCDPALETCSLEDGGATGGGGGATGGGGGATGGGGGATGGGGGATGGGGGATGGGGGATGGGGGAGPTFFEQVDAGGVKALAVSLSPSGALYFASEASDGGVSLWRHPSTLVDQMSAPGLSFRVESRLENQVLWASAGLNSTANWFRSWARTGAWQLRSSLSNINLSFPSEPGCSTDLQLVAWYELGSSPEVRRSPGNNTGSFTTFPATNRTVGSGLVMGSSGTTYVPFGCERALDGGCTAALVGVWRADGGVSVLSGPRPPRPTDEPFRQRVAVTSDGGIVAALRWEQHTVYVWRFGAPNPVALRYPAPLDGGTFNLSRLLAISDDGETLVVGLPRFNGTTPVGTDLQIHTWDGTSYDTMTDFISASFLTYEGLSLSGDGRTLATASTIDGELRLYRR